MTYPAHLYVQGVPELSGRPLGSLRLNSVGGPQAGEGGLRMSVEYQPPADSLGASRLVQLATAIASAWPTRRVYGRIRQLPDPAGQQALLGSRSSTHSWVWSLAQDEIELIEAERAPNSGADRVVFNFDAQGIAVVDGNIYGFGGDTQFSIATADWLGLIRALGYAVAPSLRALAGEAMILGASWGIAEQKLRDARRLLALGEDREALRTAYLRFDSIARNPYRPQAWAAALADPELAGEKATIVSELMSSYSTMLNRLGRHPSDQLTENGDRQMLPLDHWEAELLIAIGQLLLAAAERLRSFGSAHERVRPVGPTDV